MEKIESKSVTITSRLEEDILLEITLNEKGEAVILLHPYSRETFDELKVKEMEGKSQLQYLRSNGSNMHVTINLFNRIDEGRLGNLAQSLTNVQQHATTLISQIYNYLRPVKNVILNGKEIKLNEDIISYEDILQILGHDKDQVLTVTYSTGLKEPGGMLIKGQSVAVVDGMMISAMRTGNA